MEPFPTILRTLFYAMRGYIKLEHDWIRRRTGSASKNRSNRAAPHGGPNDGARKRACGLGAFGSSLHRRRFSAWTELVSSQHRRVYGLCYRFTGNATDAEDLTQDLFLKLYSNLENFDTTRGSLPVWIATMTRNMLVDNYRRNRNLARPAPSMKVGRALMPTKGASR